MTIVTFTAPAPPVTAGDGGGTLADPDKGRTIRGLAVPYGIAGATSGGSLVVDAGSLSLPDDLRRVKLFRDHGRTTPVGYTIAAEDAADGLTMSFRAARTADGELALVEAAEGVRDALSVELDNVDVRNGHVTAADLVAVALVPIPAFADARIAAADTDPTGDPMHDDTLDQTPDLDLVEPTAASSPPAALTASLASTVSTARRPALTAAQATEALRRSIRGATDAAQVNAALSDIVPGDDTGQGFIRDQWLGELWSASDERQPYVDAISSGVLTGLKFYGWQWVTKPVVDDYAGNKAPIPSGPVEIAPAEGNAYRVAGGWDVDRAYVDLGAPGFLEALFSAAIADEKRKMNSKVGAFLSASATVSTAIVGNLVDALGAVAAFLGANGAIPSFIAISSDLWSDYLSLTSAEAPWWLSLSAGSVSMKDSTGRVADLSFFVDPGLTASTVLAGDRRAATHYEPSGSPIRLQALNLPNGGIDIAVMGYGGDLVNDVRGLVKQAVTAGP